MARNRQRARERKGKLRRESVPGELDHASSQVDAAEAAIVAGAGGEPREDLDDAALEAEALEETPAPLPAASAGRAAEPRKRGLARVWAFFKACWAELERVQWPDRRQVGQATAVVLGFVVIAGAYLGLADKIAQELVDLII